jgi:hypothetical protein
MATRKKKGIFFAPAAMKNVLALGVATKNNVVIATIFSLEATVQVVAALLASVHPLKS